MWGCGGGGEGVGGEDGVDLGGRHTSYGKRRREKIQGWINCREGWGWGDVIEGLGGRGGGAKTGCTDGLYL